MKYHHLIHLFIYTVLFYSCSNDEILEQSEFKEEYREACFSRFPDQNDTITTEAGLIVISNPYKNTGKLRLKGAMHNHTENSAHVDGYLSGGTPKWTCEKFRDEAHYDFISLTDHNFVTRDPEVEGIVWLGESLEDTDVNPTGHHLVVYNLPKGYQFHWISDDINEQVEYYHKLGAIVSYAHPDWTPQYQSDEKIINLRQIDFVEVLNCSSGSTRAYNSMLSKGPVLALGTDDFHYNPSHYEANKYFDRSYIIVFGHKKERSAIWDDILRGHFYASSGAKMEITQYNGVIKVNTDIPSTIEFHGINPMAETQEVVLSYAKNVIEHNYAIDGTQSVIWIRVTNNNGRAISQAFHIKRL